MYRIYFTFNSDALRDESEPTLIEIAALLRKHTDWKLRVNGHGPMVRAAGLMGVPGSYIIGRQ